MARTIERRARPQLDRDPNLLVRKALAAGTNRSHTADRFLHAYEQIHALAPKMSRRRPADAPIGRMVEDESIIKSCVSIVNANILTGFRIGMSDDPHCKPMPSVWSHVTQFEPPPSTETNLINVRPNEFLILLATAMRLNLMGMIHSALRLVYELHAHDANGALYDWGSPGGLTCLDARFALASLGVKVARKLFRKPESSRVEIPGDRLDPALSTRALLDAVEFFASEQCELKPASPVGWWNRGWVVQQAAPVRGVDGLMCAATCLRWFTRCFEAADAEGDDFYSSAARIEAAMCTCLGGAGFVGYKVNGNEPGQVQRDMQVEQGSASSMRVLGSTPAICSALVDKEKDRVARGVHPSTLEDGETLLVEWWVVLQLWNEAMAPFDALAEWGHEHYVYGESTGWHIVEAFLDANITRLKLAHGQYALTPDRVGGFAAAFSRADGGLRSTPAPARAPVPATLSTPPPPSPRTIDSHGLGAERPDDAWRNAEGWGNLTAAQQDALRKHHLKYGCTVPWALTGLEVPEMLMPPSLSSLRIHPNQRFQVAVQDLPSFRIEMPGAEVDGLRFPLGRRQAFLREVMDDSPGYLSKVPLHMPTQTAMAVLGEVTFTKSCARGFKAFYDHGFSGGNGSFFAWPGGDASAVCPATGAQIAADGKTRHLLVAWEMGGVVTQDHTLHFAYRIIPRLLTRAGYELIMGSQGSHRCTRLRDAHGTQEERPFFVPRRKTFDGTLGDMCKWGTQAPPAGSAWSHLHSDGTYCAIERLLEDERKQQAKRYNKNAGSDEIRLSMEGRSGGHSSYEASGEGNASGASLSMKELKRAIEMAGLSHDECLEKADLLTRYKEAQEKRVHDCMAISDGCRPGDLMTGRPPVAANAPANDVFSAPEPPAPESEWRRKACSHCGVTDLKLQFCTACITAGRACPAGYCGKECQKKAWPTHKKVCKRLPIGSDISLGGGDKLCAVCNLTRVCTTADEKQTATIFYCCGAEICHACASREPDSEDCPKCGQRLPVSDEQKVKWIRKAAKRGDPRAQLNLGRAYDEGYLGLRIDHVEAASWIRKAAEQGHAKAEHDLGVCYRDGEGVVADAVEARKWFHRAALQGHVSSQCNLGIMLMQAGVRGENADLDEAKIWLQKAAAAGDEMAERKVRLVEQLKKHHAEQTGERWAHRIEEG